MRLQVWSPTWNMKIVRWRGINQIIKSFNHFFPLIVNPHISLFSWDETEYWGEQSGRASHREGEYIRSSQTRTERWSLILLYLSVCVCVSVCDRRQKRAQRHTRGNVWSLPQLCLQPCIIPVTQPEIALLWQSIYYSQVSCFCLSASVTHTHVGGGVPHPL